MSSIASSPTVRVTLAGDCLIQHRTSASTHPRLLELASILRNADLAIANLEGVITGPNDWPGFIAGQGGFGSPYMALDPWVVDELRWYGFDLVFTANNHASDFAEGGIVTTIEHLDRGGLLHAGSGRNMTEAMRPAYVYGDKARLAVVNAADNGIRSRGEIPFPVPRGCLAADQGPAFADRPGLNMLRYEPVYHVDRATLDALRRVSAEIGWEQDKELRRLGGGLHSPSVGASGLDRRGDTDVLFHFNGTKYALDDRFFFETVPFPDDLERNYRWIREARNNADVVVVGLHQQGSSWDEEVPPDHMQIFAHGAVDAGADIVVGHGHGRFGGVEVYRGSVIIYGLPGFIVQLMQRGRIPLEQLQRFGFGLDTTPSEYMDFMREAMAIGLYPVEAGAPNPSGGLAIFSVDFDDDLSIRRVLVHPLELTASRRTGGAPLLAEPGGEIARSVLDVASARTKRHGTELVVRGGVGVIEVR